MKKARTYILSFLLTVSLTSTSVADRLKVDESRPACGPAPRLSPAQKCPPDGHLAGRGPLLLRPRLRILKVMRSFQVSFAFPGLLYRLLWFAGVVIVLSAQEIWDLC